LLSRREIPITTRVKTTALARLLTGVICLGALPLVTGCFETKDEFTLNPDGSGKVTHECSFQQINLGGDNEATEESLNEAIGKVITEAKGVEAWRDVSYKLLDDGRLYFKGTAYFTNLNTLDIPNQTMLKFDWTRSGSGTLLTLRPNLSKEQEALPVANEAVDWGKLTPDERGQHLKEKRAKYHQAKGIVSAFLWSMKHDVSFRLPGKLGESSNLTKDARGTLRLQFAGAKLLAALDTLMADDAWAMKNSDSIGGPKHPLLDDEVNALVFGAKAPVRAVVSGGQPLFNYAAEVAAAQQEMERLCQELGVSSGTPLVLRPAQGGALRWAKVVGARWVAKMDRKENEFRPFYQEPGYVVVLRADFPGSILAVTSSSIVTNATASDGSDLLPDQDRIRWSSQAKLSADKGSALIEVVLNSPGAGVTGLREVSGVIEYQVAGGTKLVDLGFANLQANARGAEWGAQIKSIKPGWSKNGTEQLELRLNLNPTGLKAVYLQVDALNQSQLTRRGYSGGGSSYTYTFEHSGPIPPEAQLVAEVYERLESFRAPFKLENLDLLGRPQNEK
jgi:hypothetical protein